MVERVYVTYTKGEEPVFAFACLEDAMRYAISTRVPEDQDVIEWFHSPDEGTWELRVEGEPVYVIESMPVHQPGEIP